MEVMPVLTDWVVPLDIDDVFVGQGADPLIIRKRSPQLIPVAARALAEAEKLIRNVVVYTVLDVRELSHNRLKLEGDCELYGEFVTTHLWNATRVFVVACTISDALGQRIGASMKTDIVYGMALDGIGSSAVQKLSSAASARFSSWAAEENLQTTIPFNPGIIGWPVKSGQKQIFDILENVSREIRLSESSLMIPLKSLSFVLGVAPEVEYIGDPCQLCSLRETCMFRKKGTARDCHKNDISEFH